MYADKPLFVYYAPVHLEAYPRKTIFSVGDRFLLKSDANPPAEYLYEDSSHDDDDDDEATPSRDGVFYERDAGSDLYKLTAFNRFKGQEHRTSQLWYLEIRIKTTVKTIWVQLIVTSLALIACLILTYSAYYRIEKRRQR